MRSFKPIDYDRKSRFNYIQKKLDGHWLRVERNNCGVITCTSSLGTDLTDKLKHNWWYAQLLVTLPFGTVVEGELLVLGKPASYVKTAIAEHQQLEFIVFAIPMWKNAYRYADVLETVATWTGILGLEFAAYERVDGGPDDIETLLELAAQRKYEGWVLKVANYHGWWKIKVTKTLDAFVTGFNDGRGKNIGGIGSLRVSVYCDGEAVEIASAGGMKDHERWMMDEVKDLGRVCEVKYQSVLAKGRLQHPVFIRWRDDKDRVECAVNQDEALVYAWQKPTAT